MRIPFDRVADIYDKSRELPPQTMKKTIQALVQELKGCKRVLDVGVGTGRFAKPLQQKRFEVVGIDIARSMMQQAKHKGVKSLVLADACHIPFRHQTFDAALSVHVLHLIKEWQKALKEICRVTRHGLFSLSYQPRRNPISEAYENLAEERRYHVRHVGLSEWRLVGFVKPSKSILASNTVSKADEYLAFLKQRAYSRQWRIPEKVDKQIVSELVRRFSGQHYKLEVHILRWNIKDLKSCLVNQA